MTGLDWAGLSSPVNLTLPQRFRVSSAGRPSVRCYTDVSNLSTLSPIGRPVFVFSLSLHFITPNVTHLSMSMSGSCVASIELRKEKKNPGNAEERL